MDDSREFSDEAYNMDNDATATADAVMDDPRLEEASAEYVLAWNQLISTTNWDKGRIISQWREALIEAGAPPAAYSDDAWSRRAGNVSPQHVGRLRRVFDRFHAAYPQYGGLFWSHFQAALDWDDAEMWLEGAVQNGWSVAGMRRQRWETLGAPVEEQPRDEDVIVAEFDEDVRAEDDGSSETIAEMPSVVRPAGEVEDEDSDGELSHAGAECCETADAVALDVPAEDGELAIGPFRPFEDLPELPDDLAEAVESLKLAIVNHKLAGWRDVSCDDVLATLSALKQLALAPTENESR